MLDRYKKLVTVAEAMVTTYHQFHTDVCQMNVSVDGDNGVIGLGVFGLVGHSYHPDENQYMPEYDVTYKSYRYSWVDNEWSVLPREEDVVQYVENTVWKEQEPLVDGLPF